MPRVLKLNHIVLIVIIVLLSTAGVIAGYRISALDYDLSFLVPQRVTNLEIEQQFVGHGSPVDLRVFLPVTNSRQRVISEENHSPEMIFAASVEDGNRVGMWHTPSTDSSHTVRLSAQVVIKAVAYDIADEFQFGAFEDAPAVYLQSTKVIQSEHGEIRKLANKLSKGNGNGSVLQFMKNAYRYISNFKYKPFKGTTDALTALRLGEASCNGRSRLLVALMRAKGVPARLVGGLVVNGGTKKTSHQWAEVQLGGTWIPIDVTNGHFARLPQNYLVLYYGDQGLFRHSSDIGFDYQFRISHKMVARQEIDTSSRVLGFWTVFQKLGIPLALLKSLMMLPLAALVIVIFRNVIGLRTFGTFLPALIAIACRHTGMLWGAIGFTFIILVVSLARRVTAKLQLLHSPQLGILLTLVIGLLLFAAVLGVHMDVPRIAGVSLFPMVVVAMTAERFSIMEVEDGSWAAWLTMGQTLVVVALCYTAVSSLSLQILMLAFPELLLVIIALNVWIGRWVGLRMSEWFRFKSLLFLRQQEV